jgi:1-acyl-sn-glycerol-3-phosphate acyltransferase
MTVLQRHSTPSRLLASWRLLKLLAVTALVGIVPVARYIVLGERAHRGTHLREVMAGFQRWSRAALRAIGIQWCVEGSPPPVPCLLVPNHTSYLDIIAVSAAQGAVFVPKSEIAGWPVIGFFVRSTGHIFIRRRQSSDVGRVGPAMAERLRDGAVVAPFLEGTTSDGSDVRAFRSALLQPALDAGVPVVPCAIRYRCADPRVDIAEEVAYWREEHTFAPHAFRLMGLRGITVTVTFGEPIPVQGKDRKALAAEARAAVRALLGCAPESAEPDAEARRG